MTLEPHEIKSPLWEKLKAHMQAELQTLRERNDQPKSDIDTATLRGEIRAAKKFLLLETPAEPEPNDIPD